MTGVSASRLARASRLLQGGALAALIAATWGCDTEKATGRTSGSRRAAPKPAASPAESSAGHEKALAERLAARPDDADARLALANLYYDTDRPHRAVPLYLEALKLRDEPNIRTDLGTCYKNMGLLDQAAAEYERVLHTHANHIQATYNLAVVSELAGDAARAAELWERVAAIAPGTPIAGASLQHAAAARKKAREAPAPTSATTSGKGPQP